MGIRGVKKMLVINFIRSTIFTLLFFINTLLLIISVFFGKLFHLKEKIKKFSKNWARNNVLLLKYICGVKYEVEGKENIPQYNCLIVSKHQSTWETYFLFQYFAEYLVFIAKKELLSIPGLGTALKETGCIAVDRKDGVNALRKMNEQAKYFVNEEKRNLVIFPQGTRVPLNSNTVDYPYKGGFISIAKDNKLDILPIALNSAKCWPKFSFIKKSGTINVRIMPLIKYKDYKDLNKNEILKLIENTIEENQKTLK